MNLVFKIKYSVVIFFSVILVGCQLQEVPITSANISFTIPADALTAGKDNYKATITNIATGRVVTMISDVNGLISAKLEEGVYNIQITARKILSTDNSGAMVVANLSGMVQKINIVGGMLELSIPLSMVRMTEGFVIKEIYYAGSTTPANKSYNKDQFIELYNNSDSVLYADGISIAESQHGSSTAVPEFTDYPNDLIVDAIYTIPGNGKTCPVQPRTSLLIASMGINHQIDNPNSPSDMSKADFEWFDPGTVYDVDVPEVPNLVRNYCYSNTVWQLFVTGVRAYVIFKTSGDYTEFVNQNKIQVQTASGSFRTSIKVAHSLIIDGVELAPAGVMGSKSLPTMIDLSYTYCNGSYNGKSVRRKVLEWKNGKAVLQDTNDSASDFIPNANPKPREVE
jgi:hypothetical protein